MRSSATAATAGGGRQLIGKRHGGERRREQRRAEESRVRARRSGRGGSERGEILLVPREFYRRQELVGDAKLVAATVRIAPARGRSKNRR
jgi:hypothetical protein